MSGALDLPLSVSELEKAVAAVEPAAILAPPRILRRVIKQDRQISGIGLKVPHRKSYLIDADRLLNIVDRDELGLEPGAQLAGTVLLLARPDADYLATLTAGEALVKYWRLLFHARIHQALDRRVQMGELDAATVRQRILRLGAAEFAEIRSVLAQEDFLLPPVNDVSAYIEFAALFFELRFFVASLMRRYFPSLTDLDQVSEILESDIEAEGLWVASRPAGAPTPVQVADESDLDLSDEVEAAELTVGEARPSEGTYRWLNRRADRAAATGNAVRAAILRTRAARYVRPSVAHRVRAAARDDLRRLTHRLQAALNLSDKDAWRWSQVMTALLSRSVHGYWTREGRTLYDLQKVCLDFEREVYTLDLVEWALARGRVPLKRYLPGQRELLMSKHLRVALGRAAKARIDDRERRRLVHLLQSAVAAAERRLRGRFRPPIAAALEGVGLKPANVPERIASKKLIEELLDRVVKRDFLTMSDLRDAISRNNLKLPDLESARQVVSGDQVLEADRALAASLDGVYHRGEVYLRLPQRLSSMAFGTALGRVLVRYLAIPYGGAYLLLKFVEHLVLLITGSEGGHAEQVVATGEAVGKVELIPPGVLHFAVFALGTVLLGLIYVESFRKTCIHACRLLYRGVRWLAVELPAWLLKIPFVRTILESPLYRFAGRYVVKPLVFTVLIMAAFRSSARDRTAAWQNGVIIFFTANLVLNSRVGRNAEELITDWLVHNWYRFRLRVLGALVQVTMEFFNRVVDTIDRLLYSVDEWLRFRSGQGQVAVVTKAVLGLLWFFVRYVVRFCITLLIEPQINPVKHFPVVTVSHKILFSLAFTPAVHDLLLGQLKLVLAPVAAEAVYWWTTVVLPGVVGFLVWELKENWRLYKANRPLVLQPVGVGQHGESVSRLLRFGFHSGTIPKLFARLRRADRKALWTGNWKKSRKHRDALESVEHKVRDFVNREFVELLGESRRFLPLRLRLGRIELGVNSIRFELNCSEIAEAPLRIGLAERSGWLTSRIIEPGWAARLSDVPRQALADALTGLYKMAGVELVHEQIAANLDPQQTFEITDRGLTVFSASGEPLHAFDLRDDRSLVESDSSLPVIRPEPYDREALLFASWPVPWDLWVEVWDRDQAGGRYTPRLVVGAQILPQSLERAVS
ncbi:MAG TPA: hypothetical protein VG826_19060 [Pirellulales bacterium]|nr:hypothetical protein [Pirellulales bacterium]